MATVIEETKIERGAKLVQFSMWVLVLVLIGIAAYYVFFAEPQIVEIAVPTNFKSIDPLAGLNLNPGDVVNSTQFQALRVYISQPPAANTGKSNPFAP